MTEARKIQATELHPVYTEKDFDDLESKYEELKKEMNQFTYIVSHDLQAPLRMVTGFLELLERKHGEKLDSSAKQYIEYAVKGAMKMKDLVFDLLDLSRLNSVPQELADLDPLELIKEAQVKLQNEIAESSAVIEYGELQTIKADRKQMVILFTQLLDNAIKFRSEEPLKISVNGYNDETGTRISITDNGIGIDPMFEEKIFVVFRRLHTDEIKYPGTGIGLALCKKIMELHNGRIGVKPAQGRGSRFTIYFP